MRSSSPKARRAYKKVKVKGKKFGRLSNSAQNDLRAATVHLEEADYHARTGNCREAFKRFEEGVQALGAGLAEQDGTDDHGLGEIKAQARRRIKSNCLR